MARLFRPHVPLAVRCDVAERQLLAGFEHPHARVYTSARTAGGRLKVLLAALAAQFGCEVSELRLDHDPPLGARRVTGWPSVGPGVHYEPDANDPDHLFYRPHGPQHAGSHLIKTNIRGDHGQHPDRVLIKKDRRLTENKPPRRKVKIKSRGFDKVSRPFQKRRKSMINASNVAITEDNVAKRAAEIANSNGGYWFHYLEEARLELENEALKATVQGDK